MEFQLKQTCKLSAGALPALCRKCRDDDCDDVDPVRLAECRRLGSCRFTSVPLPAAAADEDWNGGGGGGAGSPSSRSSVDGLTEACVRAHCAAGVGGSTTADRRRRGFCARCYRRRVSVERTPPPAADDTDRTAGDNPRKLSSSAAADGTKRAGFTDTAGACMAFHCSGKTPGTIEFLLCASRNRCAG